ncbi:MAG: DNA polymerase III subunit delta [Geobacter sp.]|nr:DNA polymerase III subunit delta [Geobacter sp.]
MTEQDLDKQIKTGSLLPVYFLYGDEPFLVDRAARRIMEQAIDPAMKDFNLNVYYGAECKGTEILDTAQTLPMFSDRRLVVVRQTDKLPVATQEGLLPYLAYPCPEACLLFLAAKPDLRRKCFAELKKQQGTLEFKKLYDNKLVPFISAEAQTQGKKIDGAGAEMLAFLVGNNLQELVSQIEKAALYVGTRPVIGVDDVKAIVSQSKEYSAFELARFMGEKNLPKALATLQSMLQNGEEAIMILGALASHFRRIWRIRELLDQKITPVDISKQLKIHQFFLNEQISQARKYPVTELEVLFERLYQGDVGIKTGASSATVLQGVVYDSCKGSA